ncbi:MAG: YdcF family protein [Acidobacteriaceae bacterium]|nr:YdcF family protein [Acidobacteriaceae bacterium]
MKRALAGLLALAVLLSILFLGYLFRVARKIERQSTIDEAQAADVIIVLGAAQYRGKPSPILQARLNHALILYLRGLAPYILTTGGAGGDPDFTEGEVGRAYLTEHGVPPEAIIVDPEGATTAQSLDAAAETMRRMNLHLCIVVSDGYHIFRVKRLLESRGIRVYGSPRPSTAYVNPGQLRWLYLRQALGYALWRIGINI